MAEKYDGYSPYGYVNNNPLLFIDPDGRDIWINYGDNQRVQYRDGRLYNEDGSRYKGKDQFVNTVNKNLNQLMQSKLGASLLSSLTKSENDFTFKNINTVVNGKTIPAFAFSPNNDGKGGTIKAGLLMENYSDATKLEAVAHELFHGYQTEYGETSSVNKEVGGYLFARAVMSELGYKLTPLGLTATTVGRQYEGAMSSMLKSNSFDLRTYYSALNSFKQGSVANIRGIYTNKVIRTPDVNPVIKKFFPLVRK